MPASIMFGCSQPERKHGKCPAFRAAARHRGDEHAIHQAAGQPPPQAAGEYRLGERAGRQNSGRERLDPLPDRTAQRFEARERRTHTGQVQSDQHQRNVGGHEERNLHVEQSGCVSSGTTEGTGRGSSERVGADTPGVERREQWPGGCFARPLRAPG